MLYVKRGCIHDGDDFPSSGSGMTMLHFTNDGYCHSCKEMPRLGKNDGFLEFKGPLFTTETELLIAYVKARNTADWMNEILMRHIEKVRVLQDDLEIYAEIHGVE